MEQNQPFDDNQFDRVLEMQDFFPKIFLQPKQIRLDREQGLRVITRHAENPDKFDQNSVRPIKINQRQIRKFSLNPQQGQPVDHPAGDGLISLFRRTKQRRIKVAICVCVYSEAKHMLKATIKGVQQSNQKFLQDAGIMSHQIIVIVIFDGIEHLNNSKDQTENMISFFNEIDIKNGFRHRTNSLSIDEFLKELQAGKVDMNTFNDDKLGQINLFTQQELSTLQPKLFENQYTEYTKTKKLLCDIQNLKKNKDIQLENLPFDVVKKYEELCIDYCAANSYEFNTFEQMQQYINSMRKNVKFRLMWDAMCAVQDLCRKYLNSREDKVILYPVRMQKDYLRNPRDSQNLQQEFSSLLGSSDKKVYNYLFLCVKHKNSGKLNSHMLFFEGFCKLFDPEYCVLTDVGVKPRSDAIFQMYRHLELTPKCGGVCGYMSLKIENHSDDLGYRIDGYNQDEVDCFTRFFNYFVSIQRAQQFEYHYAHMIDKPFQSFFDYIHVLPGAFSGYRWNALKSITYKQQDDSNQPYGTLQLQTQRYSSSALEFSEAGQSQTLLKRYLKTALSDNPTLTLQDSNMYLAQDRILCLGIHALGYVLHYLPDVQSYVDPVTSLTKLLGQRRRWINGSWFAFNYVRQHWRQSSSCLFLLQLLYYTFVQGLQWFSCTLFYLAMNLTLISFISNNLVPQLESFFQLSQDFQLGTYKIFFIFNVKYMLLSIPDIVNFSYVVAVFAMLLWSLQVNNNNHKFKAIYYGASTLLGVYGVLVLALLFYNVYSIIQVTTTTQDINQTGQFVIPLIYLRALILFVVLGMTLPILWTCNFRKTVELVTSLASYIYFSPTYINILQIFAFCRIDDLSWGTKGLDKDEKSEQMNNWQKKKYFFVLQYVASNVLLSYILIRLTKYDLTKNIIILITTALIVFLLGFRLIFAFCYILKYHLTSRCKKISSEKINQNRSKGQKVLNALRLIEMKIKEIEKEKTKLNKMEEMKNLTSVTSVFLSKALSSFGRRIRNKVARHIVKNNMLPKKDILNSFKKRLKNYKKTSVVKKNQQFEAQIVIPEVDQKNEKSQSDEVTETLKRLSGAIKKDKVYNQKDTQKETGLQAGKGQRVQVKNILKSIRNRLKAKGGLSKDEN